MIRYIAVAGTNAARTRDWDTPDSPFSLFLQEYDCFPLVSDRLRRYTWSTVLDGVDSNHTTWDAAGRALADYINPPLLDKTLHAPVDTFIIAHSHGGNVVAYACGKYGLKVNGLITVGMPVRNDLYDLYEVASSNVQRHLHIHAGWKDYWQVVGALWDGRFGIHKEHPFAKNAYAPGGHGTILRNKRLFKLWDQNGWLNYWIGRGPNHV